MEDFSFKIWDHTGAKVWDAIGNPIRKGDFLFGDQSNNGLTKTRIYQVVDICERPDALPWQCGFRIKVKMLDLDGFVLKEKVTSLFVPERLLKFDPPQAIKEMFGEKATSA